MGLFTMHPKDPILQCPGVRSNKSVMYHVNNGFYFNKHRQDDSRVYLRCIRRDICDCRASMPLSEKARTVDNLTVLGKHSHGPDFSLLSVVELRRAILHRCCEEETDYKTIFDEECARFPKHISSQLDLHRCSSTMYRQRRVLKERILHLTAHGGELPKKPVKRKKPLDPDKKKKAKTQHTLSDDAVTSCGNQSSHIPECLSSDSEPSPSTRNKNSNPDIKEEGVKDELMLEDCDITGGVLEETYFEESESNENAMEESNVYPSTSSDAPVPFETVVCDGGIQVKQEVVEDEMGNFEMTHESATSLKSADSVSTAVHNTTEPSSSGCHENVGKIDSLDALTRLTTTLGTANKPSQETGTLDYTIPTDVQTVAPSQPLVITATTPNYIGVIMSDSYTLTNYSAATATNYNMAANTNFCAAITTNYSADAATTNFRAAIPTPACFASLPAISATSAGAISATNTSAINSTNAPVISVTNPPPISATNAPSQPPRDESSSCTSDCEDLEGVFISLKKVPMERRKKTKGKLLRLVKLISELDLDPDEVSFSVTTK